MSQRWRWRLRHRADAGPFPFRPFWTCITAKSAVLRRDFNRTSGCRLHRFLRIDSRGCDAMGSRQCGVFSVGIVDKNTQGTASRN
jgi:hypothetical protein